MGASAPIVLTSRSDDERSKLLSIALATLIHN
jgi:phosphate butyryltransferase